MRWPSPGLEEDAGKGDVMAVAAGLLIHDESDVGLGMI